MATAAKDEIELMGITLLLAGARRTSCYCIPLLAASYLTGTGLKYTHFQVMAQKKMITCEKTWNHSTSQAPINANYAFFSFVPTIYYFLICHAGDIKKYIPFVY